MNSSEARKILSGLDARSEEQRGFYSHFLRVWYPADAERSLGTIDFTAAGVLPKRKVEAMARRITALKQKEQNR